MKKFNIIKKSRKKSKGIDEKIEYLNKECQKTGLQEVMTTSNIYVGTEDIPNTTYIDFESITVGGYQLGLSGADGNAGVTTDNQTDAAGDINTYLELSLVSATATSTTGS